MKKLFLMLCALILSGCASGPIVDRSLSARSQDSRVRYIIIHYTVLDLPRSVHELTEEAVSSHYLLTDGPVPRILGLVDENRRAFHAGLSSWKGATQLNASSIGIEIVNPGYRNTPEGAVWAPFQQSQIDLLIPLVQDIAKRHGVTPERVLAHSDIAPQRKEDPGPLFPWKQLADAGLVQWPDASAVARKLPEFEALLPDAAWFQKKLRQHGFEVPQHGELDVQTRRVISVFQMKYRPARFDGTPDAQTAALLAVLVP
ncbi:MAG: N-acetylmuramoyl-L-alanine amidase [Betaproteobacteria bacterium]